MKRRSERAAIVVAVAILGACGGVADGIDRSRASEPATPDMSDTPANQSGAPGDTQPGAAGSPSAPGAGAPAMQDAEEPAQAGGAGAGAFHSGLTPPDPNVSFEWTATLPGSGDCRPGRYTGTFTCEYFFAATDPAPLAVVTGPIAITLEESQDGEFLEISDGKLEGIAQLIIGFRAQLEGRLECATRTLDAQAVNGVYGFGDPAVLPFGMFQGTLGGVLDPSTAALDGDWDLSVAAGGFCKGPWQANWAP